MSEHEEGPAAARLRAALHAEAERVNPVGNGLTHIQNRIGQRHPRGWPLGLRPFAIAASAVLLVSGGAVVTLVALHRNEQTELRIAAAPDDAKGPSSESNEASSPPGKPADSASPDKATVPVYFLGETETRNGPQLYREFHQAQQGSSRSSELSTDKLKTTLTTMFTTEPADPDLDNPWSPRTQVLGVNRAGDLVTVDLSQEASTTTVDSKTAQLGLQQLVYSVSAADESVRQVRVLVEGEEPETLLGQPAPNQPLTRAPRLDVQAPVWIVAPQHGDTVSQTFTMRGWSAVFEATVSWEVVRDGKVVKEGFAQAERGAPEFGAWQQKLTLEPGRYELRAFEESAEDGSHLFIDTKTITVE